MMLDEPGKRLSEAGTVVDFDTSACTKSKSLDPQRKNVSAVLVRGFGAYPNLRLQGGIQASSPIPPTTWSDSGLPTLHARFLASNYSGENRVDRGRSR